MGLGPHGSSLLERLDRPEEPFPHPFAMMLEQQDRQEARRERAMQLAMKHRAKQKPLAPVGQVDGKKPRVWEWQGEPVVRLGIEPGMLLTGEAVRKAGFRLPRLVKRGKQKKGKT